jgi:hypothetical protein
MVTTWINLALIGVAGSCLPQRRRVLRMGSEPLRIHQGVRPELHAVHDHRRRLPRVLGHHPLLCPGGLPLVLGPQAGVPVFEGPPHLPHNPR